MTDDLLLNWAAMTLSLFNAVLLLWLGLMVLLNSDRRTWGIWLGGLGLLLGGAFFISHTAILGLGILISGLDRLFWWTVGVALAIALPFAWYIVILWYAGYWEDSASELRQRQRPWLAITVLTLVGGLAALAIGVALLLTPSPAYSGIRWLYHWSVSEIPLLALGYAVFAILSISLSLDALRRPGPSARVMGTLARQRARPWLTAVSLVLLAVSLVVGGMTVWLVQSTRTANLLEFYDRSTLAIARLDLLLSFLLAIAVILLGQAIISYEAFTGKALPRRGLQNQWRWAIVLAAGYGIVVGGSFALGLHPLYIVVPATLLMTFALALVNWRSFAERERYIAHLRPFVASQHLYEQLLTADPPPRIDISRPFHTLCADVLGARIAYLVALGSLAPLVGPPLAHPRGEELDLPRLAELPRLFTTTETMIVPLDPGHFGDAIWGVPLWSQRGLIGVLLLGEKADGGLYTQEEIEIARVSGERLIDTQASVVLGQRIMALQRQRLGQSQVVDLRIRRLLHDEVLPGIQTALIALDGQGASSSDGPAEEVAKLLTDAHHQISDLLRQMPASTMVELERLGVLKALRRAVDHEYAGAFDEINWQIDPQAAGEAEGLSPLAAEALFYAAREAVRNAAIHGRDPASESSFCLWVSVAAANDLKITVEDNGAGLNPANLGPEGNGQGLALHSAMMAIVGGTLELDSLPGQHTKVRLSLPKPAGNIEEPGV
jgi:signal transduction histidine kinase